METANRAIKAMEAPKCRTCGEKHWERVCPRYASRNRPPELLMRSAPPSRRIAALEAEIEQLQAEIKALKRELAGRPPINAVNAPVNAVNARADMAGYMREWRAKRKMGAKRKVARGKAAGRIAR
jgi:hypothetical protein